MKIKRLYGLICLLLLFSLAGCGGKDKKDKKETATSTDAAVTTEAKVTTEERKKDEDGFYITNDYVTPANEVAEIMIKPAEGSGIYRYMSAGEIVNRTGYDDKWSKVVVDNTDFYVMSDQLKKTKKVEEKEEETEETEETDDEEEEQLPLVIAIDPGNQSIDSVQTEEIGPDSQTTKKCASTGNVGTTYETKAYEINLKIALKLRDELEARGYEVHMTRETDDVDMSNKQRGRFAANCGAQALIKLQMGFSSNKELTGAMAVTMTSDSPYNASLYEDSNYLATKILQALILETGVNNQGILETNEMTTINWCEVPVTIIRPGFLSNASDEANLLDESYQAKLVKGMADGIDGYYKRGSGE